MRQVLAWFVVMALVSAGCATSETESDSPRSPGLGTHDSGVDVVDEATGVTPLPEAGYIEAAGPTDLCGDGLDNDGDGKIDEDCSCEVGETQPCYDGEPEKAGIGACVRGIQECKGNGTGTLGHWGTCEGSEQPSKDECDGVDNNCDGTTDEGCPCVDGKEQDCSNVCGSGKQVCKGGAWDTCSAPVPQPESCNNLDDDCNGQTDDNLVELCTTACGNGQKTCSNGQWGDCSAQKPVPETCNGKDDDCDGTTDEGDVCPGCPSQTLSWEGCQGTIDPAAHGQQRHVPNAVSGKAGEATFTCDKGTWVKVSGSCGTSLCTQDWGPNADSSGNWVQIYVALLNRSPDPAGLHNWNTNPYTDQNVYAFTTSGEAKSEFQNFASPDFIVTHIYQTAFNRSPTTAGHDYWVGQFNNGTYRTNDSSLGSFVRTILSSAASADAQALQNRVDGASYYTRQLIDHRCPWDPPFGKSILVGVGTSTNVAIPKSKIDQKIKDMEATIKK